MNRGAVRAITIDLDDTLWPVGPAIVHAETTLHTWLEVHAPAVAREYPAARMRALREAFGASLDASRRSDIAYIRRSVMAQVLTEVGDDPDKALVAYEVFDAARQQVELFPDALPALQSLAERYPVVALSNGTADVYRVGIGAHFAFALSPRTAGFGKPDPRIFQLACERLGVLPHEVLHVGDDAALDVEAALAAGMQTVWINRNGRAWTGVRSPHLIASSLSAVVDWLEAADRPAP